MVFIIGYVLGIYPALAQYSKLLDFNGTNGSAPLGSLTLSGNILYGMTSQGGVNNLGRIFKINTDGTGYTMLL